MQVDTPVTNVSLDDVQLSPLTDTNRHYLSIATAAANDLLSHWWIGTASVGQIANTWNGFTTNLPDSRGGLWERGMLLRLDRFVAHDGRSGAATAVSFPIGGEPPAVSPRMNAAACGTGANNFAVMMRAGLPLSIWMPTTQAATRPLALCRGIINNALTRLDDQLGGGMWCDDSNKSNPFIRPPSPSRLFAFLN